MSRRMSIRKNSPFLEIKIIEHRTNDILFQGKAKISDGKAMKELFSDACHRGLDLKKVT